MPNKNTFSIKPIYDLIEKYFVGDIWVDPFARNSPFNSKCTFTNDLNKETQTTHHLEALEFLKQIPNNFADGVLFDPPYSPRQISECYQQVGKKVHMKDTQSSFYGDRKKQVARIVKENGIVICCGWNSGGIGKSLGFEMIECLMVPHGGAHNDTIITVEKKLNMKNYELWQENGTR